MTDQASTSLERLLAMPAFATSGKVALKPGFDRIEALLAGMGHPEKGREIVLVAGTNGKGSTASMLAALSTAAGVRTGLHTSPHLLYVGERMRVDGVAPDVSWLSEAVERWEPLFESVQPSFFEATLALSLHWFAECDASRWVVEIGLGGRLDAANVLDATLGILTSVGRDHMELLGPTLADVAREKAAIARRDRPFVLGPLIPEARIAALDVLADRGAQVIEIQPDRQIIEAPDRSLTLTTGARAVSDIMLELTGPHQRINALLALEAIDQLSPTPIGDSRVREGFAHTAALSGLRARQEWVNPSVMVDVGHNEDALRSTFDAFIGSTEGFERHVVLGFLADKTLGALGSWLHDRVSDADLTSFHVITVDIDGSRGQSAERAADVLRTSGWTGPIECAGNVADTIASVVARGGRTLVGGSYRTASVALEVLSGTI